MPNLIKNQTYTWSQILAETGAANVLPYYLLRTSASRTIVASSLDIKTNPRAPYEILAGDGREIKRWANVAEKQIKPFAVFVCELDGKSYFRGHLKCVDSSIDAKEIALRAEQANRKDIYKILFLTEVPT